jgi:hypothetical protein
MVMISKSRQRAMSAVTYPHLYLEDCEYQTWIYVYSVPTTGSSTSRLESPQCAIPKYCISLCVVNAPHFNLFSHDACSSGLAWHDAAMATLHDPTTGAGLSFFLPRAKMEMVKMTATMSESKMPRGEYDMVMKSDPQE